jgi:hypothetical protein
MAHRLACEQKLAAKLLEKNDLEVKLVGVNAEILACKIRLKNQVSRLVSYIVLLLVDIYAMFYTTTY